VVLVVGVTETEPLMLLLVVKPEPRQLDELVLLHVSVVLCPLSMLVGDAVRVAVGVDVPPAIALTLIKSPINLPSVGPIPIRISTF